MSELRNRKLFISHAWQYTDHYNTLVRWFNEEPYFSWSNYSVPRHDACNATTYYGLRNCLTNQIRPAQGVIILAGMYAAHSDWIQYEIDESVRMNKIIIGVRPWGHERIPQSIQVCANIMVYWHRESIIKAIRDLI